LQNRLGDDSETKRAKKALKRIAKEVNYSNQEALSRDQFADFCTNHFIHFLHEVIDATLRDQSKLPSALNQQQRGTNSINYLHLSYIASYYTFLALRSLKALIKLTKPRLGSFQHSSLHS